MIEVIKRHLAERNMLKTAGLSLCYLEKKGEEKCVRAAEAIIQNEVMDVIPSLWEQVCLYMMEDPETITYLGNLKKEGCELNAYRFQRILLDAGTDKVSDFSYEQVKAVYFDPLVTDGTAYSLYEILWRAECKQRRKRTAGKKYCHVYGGAGL